MAINPDTSTKPWTELNNWCGNCAHYKPDGDNQFGHCDEMKRYKSFVNPSCDKYDGKTC